MDTRKNERTDGWTDGRANVRLDDALLEGCAVLVLENVEAAHQGALLLDIVVQSAAHAPLLEHRKDVLGVALPTAPHHAARDGQSQRQPTAELRKERVVELGW